jgi:hypothetical protein
MAWQTLKEGARSWCVLAAIGLVLPLPIVLRSFGRPILEWLMLVNIGVALVAGVNVFGLENRARTYRFLTHHAARPGLVWVVKLAAWIAGLALIWGPLAVIIATNLGYVGPRRSEDLLSAMFIVLLFFSVAQICGMAIRRGITAAVIGLVIGLALAVPLVALVVARMLPVEGPLVIPAGLLAVSWGWSGDWLLERPAPGRWLRLGLLVAGMVTVVVGWYAGFRAWSVPDVGPIAQSKAWIDAASNPLAPEQNAADLYREAGRKLISLAHWAWPWSGR